MITKLQLLVNKIKCLSCCQWINKGLKWKQHLQICYYCSKCKHNFTTKNMQDPSEHVCARPRLQYILELEQKREQKKVKKPRADDPDAEERHMMPQEPHRRLPDNKKIWFADFECFPEARFNMPFVVYAAALLCAEEGHRPFIWYGPDALQNWMLTAKKIKGTIYFFNGARFDNFFVLRCMVEMKMPLDNRSLVKQGNSLMTFNIHPNLKVCNVTTVYHFWSRGPASYLFFYHHVATLISFVVSHPFLDCLYEIFHVVFVYWVERSLWCFQTSVAVMNGGIKLDSTLCRFPFLLHPARVCNIASHIFLFSISNERRWKFCFVWNHCLGIRIYASQIDTNFS